MAFSFFGGVHPKENKHYAEERSVQTFPAPDLVVIPMSQHIGAPAVPCVAEGDFVRCGQVIGAAAEGLSVPVHASIDGRILKITGQAVEIQAQ